MKYDGKRVLVTGGTGGIGAATVARFHRAGARVAVGTRSEQRFLALKSAIGFEALVPAIGTLDSQTSCAALVGQASEALGGLDVLVNSAGIFEERSVAEVDQTHWDAHMALNVGGTFFCIQAALPKLRETNGNVVNVASDAGLVGYRLGSAYSASKGAIVNLTRTLALECGNEIRINCVCPGNVDTEMVRQAASASGDTDSYLEAACRRAPNGRMAEPAEIAHAILFLASDQASFINGALLPVDGGGICG